MYNASMVSLQTYISDQDYRIYQLVNYFIITGGISLFGVVTNVMNIIVFFKQGFHNAMNISFFGLAISDLCSLITLLLFDVFMSPLLPTLGARMASTEIQHLTAGIPHICFARITSWITVFMTAERCMCITVPLKIKQLITPRRTTLIICAIYMLIILSFEPEYETSYFGWKYYVSENKTLIGLLFRGNRKMVERLTYINFAILGIISFASVVILTLILVIQLNRKSKWRKNVSTETSRSESISNRDRKTMRMVVMIASVLIACYTPGVVVSLVTFCEPELSVVGRYMNEYFTCWSFVVIFESFNSSINILLYYYMSSKYKETFCRIFKCWAPKLSEHLSTYMSESLPVHKH